MAGDKEVNLYQEGDFVLACKREKMNSMKLMPRRLGPYKVLRQYKNDVLVRHMATMEELEYHVDELLLFIGSEEEAKEAALLDNDMHYIHSM